ncbi:MAG TPA: MFS transporter [Humibacter sp.]|nr:MFS transporter [Humibacter sp.]
MSENPRSPFLSSSLARWLIFAVVLAADVMDLLSTTVTNLAAPSIVRDLHAPESLAPWLGSAYALALGSMLVLGARLGDKYGTRRMFLLGLTGFTLASLACGLSTGPITIVGARVVQGAFGALLIPQGFSLLLRAFPRAELGKVFGLFGPLMAVSSISGPVLAGVLLWLNPFGLDWRAVFLINVVVGIALYPISARVLPKDAGDRSIRLDPFAAALLIVGLAGVLGGLIAAGDRGWNCWTLALILGGLIVSAVFVRRQLRSDAPFLTPALFRKRSFVAGLCVGFVFFAATAGLLYATSLYLQFGRGLAPLPTAAIMAPLSVGIIVSSFSTRGLIERMGRRLLLIGLAVLLCGTVVYLALTLLVPNAVWALVLPLLVCGLGMGCGFGSVFAVALGDVDHDQAGSASGTLNAVQQIANATGAALISTAFLAASTTATASSTGPAMVISLVVVLVITVVSLSVLPLLPRHAAADLH